MSQNYDEFLKSLDLEDSLPSTSRAQKDANQQRRKLYEMITTKRPEPSPTVFTDFQKEFITKKLQDPNYRFSFRALLDD